MFGITFSHSEKKWAAVFCSAVVTLAPMTFAFGQDEVSVETQPAKAVAPDLFQFPPTTAVELIEAARITQKLDRVSDSRAFLKQMIAMQMSDDEMQSLRREIGPAIFLELRSDSRLQPESKQLLDAVNAAMKSKARSEAELQQFVQDLSTPGVVGENAATELMASGTEAIPFLMNASPTTPAGVVSGRILESHARDLRHGLLAYMHQADAPTRVRVLNLLGGTADPDLAIRLLRWQFDPQGESSVSTAAGKAIAELSRSKLSVSGSEEATGVLLAEATRLITLNGARFSSLEQPEYLEALVGKGPRSESLVKAKLLITDAMSCQPDNADVKLLSLVAECAATNTSLVAEPSAAANRTSDELVAGLSRALDLQSPEAATEILRGIRRLNQEELQASELAPVLLRSTNDPDTRVRLMATLVTRLQLPNTSDTTATSRTIASAKHGNIKPEVVVVTGNDTQADDLRFVFDQAGYATQTAETGPDGFDLAAAQLNCELFVLHAEATRWPLATTLTNLRSDVRTRHTPIVVIGPTRMADRVTALGKVYAGVWFIPEPVGTESLLGKLKALNMPGQLLTTEDREAIKMLLN